MKFPKKIKIGIVGLGYVGLPLAIEFCKKFNVVGYDSSKKRIDELKKGKDKTNEVNLKSKFRVKNLLFSNKSNDMKFCNVFIIAVPTPITKSKKPDLSHLLNACKIVAKLLKKEDLIIFESTVFPGTTEEICAPLISTISGLIFCILFDK